jgi:transposase
VDAPANGIIYAMTVLYNWSLSRTRLATLLTEQPTCIVAMEACATSHHWGQVAQSHGHEVRLVPAAYVKSFVKRQKNDRAGECPIFCV